MRRHPPRWITLSESERAELNRLVRDGRTEQRVARRARALLAMSSRDTVVEQLAARLEITPQAIWQLCRRFEARGLGALWDLPRSGRPTRAAEPKPQPIPHLPLAPSHVFPIVPQVIAPISPSQ